MSLIPRWLRRPFGPWLLIAGFLLSVGLWVQAASFSFASQLPERFFEEYGAVMLVIDPASGNIRAANRAAAQFYGYSVEQLEQMRIQQINALDPADVDIERELARTENRNYFIFPHRLSSGEIRTVEVYSWPLLSDAGEQLLFSVIIDISGRQLVDAQLLDYTSRLETLAEQRYQHLLTSQEQHLQLMWLAFAVQLLVIALLIWNISQRRRAQKNLQEKTAILEGLLNSIPDLIFFKNKAGVYLGANARFAEFAGKPAKEIIGSTDFELFDAQQAKAFHLSDLQVLANQRPLRHEEWTTFPNGQRKLLDKIKAPLISKGDDFVGILGISRDLTERHAHEERIRQLAYYDPLTHLPNRFLLHEQFIALCQQMTPQQSLLGLAIIDLDHFKNINDALGHTQGDRLLVAVAERLQTQLEPGDRLARFGGDEYVLLLTQEGDFDTARTQLERRVEQLHHELERPFVINQAEYLIGNSLGLTLCNVFNRGLNELIKEADIALYAAKEAGRGLWKRFHPSMQHQVEDRFLLEGELRKALELGQLRLYLQPKNNAQGEIYGCESLLRWAHPEKGLIPPDVFIPLAEETGLILQLGDWVLQQTLALAVRYPELEFAVNISPREFRNPDFVERIQSRLASSQANPERLTLEVTEGLLITDFQQSSERMLELQKLGIRFSIDDFGTGYSSLSYLKKLPINELKIDRSFVRGLPQDSSDALLVETMMAVAQHLDLKVVAEGVETSEQRDFLLNVGCTHHQGYFYGKPQAAQDFLDQVMPPR